MYQTPTSEDFQRILVTIRQKARGQAHTDNQRIKAEHASRGLGRSGPLIEAVARRFDELHAEAKQCHPLEITSFAIASACDASAGSAMAPAIAPLTT